MDGSWMKANCQPTWQENHSDRESGGAGRAAWQCNGGEGHDCKQLGETNPRTDLRKRRKKKKTKWEKAASLPPSLALLQQVCDLQRKGGRGVDGQIAESTLF